ncbi:P2 family phage major capsid protein [Psychrobacter sp. JB193]|uniref:P2 family phage major capsid protein n=1 Tax=Psychrobacter sp. JB193 TaxID=2024406 RepID=UPI000BAB118D|nr:P2 family phage major capsid protein [Psychrobacter sp. JB193]PAT63160.1 major capsid protein [Psychrobacter sp. JB193]
MFTLDPQTALQLEQYKQQVARVNGAQNFNAAFNVAPSIEQKLIVAYRQVTDFLSKINIQGVKNAHGQKLGLGGNKTAASTTDTRSQPRRPSDIFNLEAIDDYLCTKTNSDIAYDYEVIDNWGYLPDFQQKLAAIAVAIVAEDMQRIGFNGTHRAKTSNKDLYPLLNDVNIGWLEKIRAYNPERHIDGITIGAGKEFKNMDALVEMAKNELIAEQHRKAKGLTAITSSELVSDKYVGLLNQNHSPMEQIAANALYQKQQLGSLPVDTPAFFVPNGLLITTHDNLSIYRLRGSQRRHIIDEPNWDRTTDYQSVNECYVVEDYSKTVLIENIVLEG